ncbi:hypothetical protein DFH07DRAFT_913579 [Mycena maculata]|uniref:Uncharacterized protein n=1 Tax=Mycena maculata TaxID=230809 RepID=A0AAD7JVL3_9AGAR|nr:hypothetical protein DFH07DRAFT_913579 [Mycena maculata]
MTNGPPASSAGPSRPSQNARLPIMSGPGLPPQLPPHPQQPQSQSYYLPASRNAPEPTPVARYQPQSQWANSWSAGYSPAAQSTYRTASVPQSTYSSSANTSSAPQNYASSAAQQTNNHAPQQTTYTPSSAQQTPFASSAAHQTTYASSAGQQSTYTPSASALNFPQRTRYTEPYPHSKVTTPKVQSQTPSVVPPPQTPAPPPLSPSPPPPKYRHWDRVIKDFLTKAGLKQALNGFEADMLVMNADFERANVPDALLHLLQGILVRLCGRLIRQGADVPEQDRPLDERKLEYVHTPAPSSQTSITKSISTFLAQNRANNDASNRAEFLHSLAEKRKRIADDAGRENPDGVADPDTDVAVPSCARTDAKPIDRDVQMKYDIAKNVDGPLRRTTRSKDKAMVPPAEAPPPTPSTRPRTKSAARELKKAASPVVVKTEPDVKQRELHFGLDQRLENIETHFSVRYVPAPPDNLLARLRFLEDHIIRLEKDYPPWAALHFNQPNRGWPPPPRATPIIVPPSMRSAVSSTNAAPPPRVAGVKTKNTGSSLQRAVMDQLAMKEARTDLAAGRRT